MNKHLLPLLLSIGLSFALTARSAEYFVAPAPLGSSSNNGTSTNTPWELQYALGQLATNVTVTVMPGDYTNGYYVISSKSGTPDQPAILRALTKWTAVIRNPTQYFNVYQCRNVIVDGLQVTNSSVIGIGISGLSNTIRNCWVAYSQSHGINAGSTILTNLTIENCLIETSGHGAYFGDSHDGHGIYLTGPDHVFRNNVVRNNAGWGIHFYTAGVAYQNNNSFYNNLTYGNVFYGAAIFAAVAEGGSEGTLPGTNQFTGNTIADGLQTAYGALYLSNNIILPPNVFPSPHTLVTNPILQIADDPATLRNNYNLSTVTFNAANVTQGASDAINSYVGFVNTNAGLYWLKSDSTARGVARSTVFAPENFFGAAQSSVTDIGAFQYSQKLERSFRRLDPSGTSGANYWSASTNQIFYIGNLYLR